MCVKQTAEKRLGRWGEKGGNGEEEKVEKYLGERGKYNEKQGEGGSLGRNACM